MTVDEGTLRRFEALPAPVRQFYTPVEYAWMSDTDKNTLEQRECEPEA